MTKPNKILLAALTLITLTLLPACQSALKGRVVTGPHSAIIAVNSDDPRLTDPYNAINLAHISLILDPESMSPIKESPVYSQNDGTFTMPLKTAGTSFLMYDALITAQRDGFKPVQQIIPMPSHNQQLLIILAPGEGKLPKSKDFVKETLELSKPYLNNEK